MLSQLSWEDETDTVIWVRESTWMCTRGEKTYEVWISLEEMVDFLLYAASLEASVATRSKISLTNEFKMDIARLEIPVSG